VITNQFNVFRMTFVDTESTGPIYSDKGSAIASSSQVTLKHEESPPVGKSHPARTVC